MLCLYKAAPRAAQKKGSELGRRAGAAQGHVSSGAPGLTGLLRADFSHWDPSCSGRRHWGCGSERWWGTGCRVMGLGMMQKLSLCPMGWRAAPAPGGQEGPMVGGLHREGVPGCCGQSRARTGGKNGYLGSRGWLAQHSGEVVAPGAPSELLAAVGAIPASPHLP